MNTFAVLQDQLRAMAIGVVRHLPNLAIALGIVALTWFVARVMLRIVRRLTRRARMRESLKELIETLVKIGVWLAGLMVALTVVLPGLTPASLIAGLGIGTVAIGFAFQDIFQNFLAGILIMIREKMRIGDLIECEGIAGKVEHITLRETHVRALSGELTVVPNAMLFKNPVRILTDLQQRRHEVVIGVSYDTDLEHARQVLREAVEGVAEINGERPIEVYAREFNASSVDFLVRWWSGATPVEALTAKDLVIRAVKRALDDANIEIPFPYVTQTFKEPLQIVATPIGEAPDAGGADPLRGQTAEPERERQERAR